MKQESKGTKQVESNDNIEIEIYVYLLIFIKLWRFIP